MRQNMFFMGLMAAIPAVFAGMFLLSSSFLAAAAVSVAYGSVILGERLD